mgnify:CR=1 FL=1
MGTAVSAGRHGPLARGRRPEGFRDGVEVETLTGSEQTCTSGVIPELCKQLSNGFQAISTPSCSPPASFLAS